MSLEQVKQWAKRAVASTGPSGRSRRAARSCPAWPVKLMRSVGMGVAFGAWLLWVGFPKVRRRQGYGKAAVTTVTGR